VFGDATYDDLPSLVVALEKKMHLGKPCPGSPYQRLVLEHETGGASANVDYTIPSFVVSSKGK
jgi:hypothetical protein